ncbi:PASTA domain-containing protein [Nocardioides sp.]|uniref:PASTA domain-containing protein n=1 Tax=Nocardioides sp. TaxID=35761 RepID=UPI003515BE19
MESDALSGRVLDRRYRLGRRIDRGGMASVYEAHDLRLDRTVAVKVMRADLDAAAPDGPDSGPTFAERFVREARAAAALSHPNVVAVYDQGEDDGVVFLAMELVRGRTLRATLREEGRLHPARALALVEPVVAALAEAHRAGLVHRDVKPENVLIADDGRVKVADFGLARAITSHTRHTATNGTVMGTVAYLAPELVTNQRADARADVYALGILLFELLTGQQPHRGDTAIAVAFQHVHEDVPAPSTVVPGLPPYLDALVRRATARDAALRPADAGVLLHQVRRVSSALAAGLADDPELTVDLTLPVRVGDTDPLPDLGTLPEQAPPASPERGLHHTAVLQADQVRPVAPPRLPPGTAGRPGRPSRPAPDGPPRRPAPVPAPVPAPGRRRWRGPVVLLLVVALVAGIAGGAFWFGWGRYDTAPSVVGLTRAQAERTLAAADLEVAYADALYDSEAPAGTVLRADPGGGDRVLAGDTVTLTLSLGKLLVPRVRGLDEDAAQDALLARQLDFGESIRRFSETVPEGTVIGSSPDAGTELRPGDTVDLVVSKGRRPLKVGNYVGEPAAKVQRVLERRGLVMTVVGQEYSDDVAVGLIIRQDPTGGRLFRGEEVRVVVSLGPELIEVPDVRAFGVSAAEQTLRDAGFEVEIRREDFYPGLGIATRTDPGAGAMAPKGSTIVLYTV